VGAEWAQFVAQGALCDGRVVSVFHSVTAMPAKLIVEPRFRRSRQDCLSASSALAADSSVGEKQRRGHL